MNARSQRGAALFTAIFLLVAIAAIAAMVATIATTQQVTSARSLDAARAFNAARTRLEREIATVVTSTPPGASCPPTDSPETIDGITTDLEACQVVTVFEGGTEYDVFTLRAAGYRGNRTAGTLVRRDLRALVTNR